MRSRACWRNITGSILLSVLLVFSMMAYASAATAKHSGSHTTTITPYAHGMTDGYNDGCTEAQNGYPMQGHPTIMNPDYQAGYASGLSQGYENCKPVTNFYQDGYNAGYADGQNECTEGLGAMVVRQSNLKHNFNVGYSNGLSDGFHAAGC